MILWVPQKVQPAHRKTGYDPRYHTYADCHQLTRSLRYREPAALHTSLNPPMGYLPCRYCSLRTERLRCL